MANPYDRFEAQSSQGSGFNDDQADGAASLPNNITRSNSAPRSNYPPAPGAGQHFYPAPIPDTTQELVYPRAPHRGNQNLQPPSEPRTPHINASNYPPPHGTSQQWTDSEDPQGSLAGQHQAAVTQSATTSHSFSPITLSATEANELGIELDNINAQQGIPDNLSDFNFVFPPYPQQNQLDIDTDMFGDPGFFTQDQLNQFDFDIPDLSTGVGTHGGKLVPHPSQQDEPDFGQFQSTFGGLTNTQPDSPEYQRPHEYTQTFDHTAGDQSMGDFSRSHGDDQYQSDQAMSTQHGEEAVHSTRAGQATPSQADVTMLRATDAELPNQSPSSKPNAPGRGSRGKKRPFPGVDASATASPTPGGAKRTRFDGEALAKTKTANQAAQAFVGVNVANEAILDAPAYVDEATSIQAAKDRLARTAPSIEYHCLNIQSNNVNVYTHEELMPVVFQRLIDAIMLEPGIPSYVDDDRKASFTKKHGNRYKLCCSLLETKEQQLDAIASFELLVAAIKELSTHGIAIADLDQEEYNKSKKQKLVTRGDMLVDQELTFLQRIDRIVEVCGACKWTAVDVLKGSKSNKEDIVANPDLYAKRKYAVFKNNDSRDSRLQDTKAAKAEAAMLRGEGVADDGVTTMTKAKRGRKAKAKSNFPDLDTVEGAAMQDEE